MLILGMGETALDLVIDDVACVFGEDVGPLVSALRVAPYEQLSALEQTCGCLTQAVAFGIELAGIAAACVIQCPEIVDGLGI